MLSLAFLLVALVLAICAAGNVSASPRISFGWAAIAFFIASVLAGRL